MGEGPTGRSESAPVPSGIDTTVAHQARIYDYWLGGKDNFAVDREAAEQAIAAYPAILRGVRAQRAFLARAVRYLVEQAGVRQFLDIGTGIPTANNTHEVAQASAPDARIVYVDNDPMVLAHARALLTSSPQGATAYLDADLREPDEILARAADLLDFRLPVAVMLIGILQLIPDVDDPYAIVARLLEAVSPGSWLAVYHPPATSTTSSSPRRSGGSMPAPPVRRPCVLIRRSRGSSTACSCWNPAWCRYSAGSPARSRPTTASRSPPMPASPASPDRGDPLYRKGSKE
jgi:hypothetical protein